MLITEVVVEGADGALKRAAEAALTTRPSFAYTLQEIRDDLQRVYNTGWFSNCDPMAEETRDGVKLVIKVTPNPELKSIVATGADALPNTVVQEAFRGMYGKTVNFKHFAKGLKHIDTWYKDNGVLGQVVDFAFDDGVAELAVGEVVVASMGLQFTDKEGGVKPKGVTRPQYITRHLQIRPGRPYDLKEARQNVASVYATGLFEDVNIMMKEADSSTEMCPQVDLTLNLVERKTGGLGAGTGLSSAAAGEGAFPGFVGSFSYSQKNLFGRGQRLTAVVELGQADKMFRLQHVDPWLFGDPFRTSRSMQLMNNRSSGNAIHGPVENEPDDTPGGSVMLGRLISGVEFQRPLSRHWSGTLGTTWQRTHAMTEAGQPLVTDRYGSPVTFSGTNADTCLLTTATATYNSPYDSTHISVSAEQSLPLRREWLNLGRLRGRVDIPFEAGRAALVVRLKGGATLGDLPPYEAFPIGGTNSVRGYAEGGVGSGRYSLEGSVEARWRLVSSFGLTFFADYGSDLDSGVNVLGDPAGARGKPGSGYGYGAGVRVDSPLGPLRLEYAWNMHKQRRFHVGLGYD